MKTPIITRTRTNQRTMITKYFIPFSFFFSIPCNKNNDMCMGLSHSRVRNEDFQRLGLEQHRAQHRPELFVQALKQKNRQTPHVRWQGQLPTPQQLRENEEWVRDYNVNGIRGGHLTSADPFMYLMSDVLQVRIEHTYQGHKIVFEPPEPRYSVRVCSNGGHMTAC